MRFRSVGAAGFAIVLLTAGVAGHPTAIHNSGDDCEFPLTVTDATGTEVTVDAEPQRIVTLNPSAAQTMWEIGGREKVVGLSEYAAYLEGAESRTVISGSGQTFVDVETVISLEPDLVLAPNTIPNETVAKLREADLMVFKFGFQTSIEDIEQKTLLIGRLTGECEGAKRTVDWMESELRIVHDAVEGERHPRVLYVFFGYTGGTGTFAHAVIETAGGTNVAAEAGIAGYQQISPEIVVESNPEWIVVNDGATQIPKTAAYNNTAAVQNGQIVVLQEEYISQPAPRIVLSIVKLAKALHPAAYERASTGTPSPTATLVSTAEQTPSLTPTPAPTPTETPGFGIGITLIALVLTIVVLRKT